ncbi:MAG TPA: hypothetical protein VGD91_15590 [Trebonia sp.]
MREGRPYHLVRDVLVNKGDPVPVRAGRNEVSRLRAVLPGLADHGQPEPLGFLPGQGIEDADEVFQAFVRANEAEEEQVNHPVLGRRPDRGNRGRDFRVAGFRHVLVLVIGAVRYQGHAHVHRAVIRLEKLPVGRRVDDAAVRQPQQGAQSPVTVAPRQREARLSRVLQLVQLDDHPHPGQARGQAQQQVGVQGGRGPPFEQQYLGTPRPQEPQRLEQRAAPPPVNPVENGDLRAVLHARPLQPDALLARVEKAGEQPAEQQDAGLAPVDGHGVGQTAGVVADAGGEPPARADQANRQARVAAVRGGIFGKYLVGAFYLSRIVRLQILTKKVMISLRYLSRLK